MAGKLQIYDHTPHTREIHRKSHLAHRSNIIPRISNIPATMDEKGVVLNKDIFEALSCDKRIEILKSLNSRRKTNSELSKELSLNASTTHHHLEKLEETELIQPIHSGHKWIYYELTPKGNALLNPDGDTKYTVLISSLLTYTVTIAAIYTYYSIPRLHASPLYPQYIEDPYLLLFAAALTAAVLQTILIVLWYRKKGTSL